MNPVIVGRELKGVFRSLFVTQFPLNAEQGVFRGMWEDFFADGERMMKGPYLKLPLPFRKAGDERERTRFAPAIARLEHMPYAHQAKAWARLAEFRPTIVATGTGSGKTECFAYPVLAHCAKHRDEPGVRAIVVYPMNALATDQARRMAEIVAGHEGLKGVRVGLYVGDDARGRGKREKEMGPDHAITDRGAMLENPPHVLLTNYKMLDYMLLREKEQALWAKNGPETLKYLVVDELHTFDGAQAADLALLVRRLKLRLGTADGDLCCAGTSATMGSGEGAAREVREYAEKIFSREFGPDSLIGEERQTFAEMKAATGDAVFEGALAEAVFGALGGKAANVRKVSEAVAEKCGMGLEEAEAAVEGFAAELSRLRADKGRAYPEVRVEWWLREAARMAASVPGKGGRARLEYTDNLSNPRGPWDERVVEGGKERVHYFPAANCNRCGATAWTALLAENKDGVGGPLETIYAHYFGKALAKDVALLYPVEDAAGWEGKERELCPKCLKFSEGGACAACGAETVKVVLRMPEARTAKGKTEYRHRCAKCGAEGGHLLFVGMRTPVMLSTCISAVTASKANADKKIIAFSDNVQDASQRAGFFGGRTWAATFRTLAAQYFARECGGRSVKWGEFSDGFWEWLQKRHGGDRREIFGELLPQNLKWLSAWKSLAGKEAAEPDGRAMKQLWVRLKWELALELGCRAGMGRTLAKTGICALKPDLPPAGDGVWEEICGEICGKTGGLMAYAEKPGELRDLAARMAEKMIATGAFDDSEHKILKLAVLVRGGLALGEYPVQGMKGILTGMRSTGVHVAAPAMQLGKRKPDGRYSYNPGELLDGDEASAVELLEAMAKRGMAETLEMKGRSKYWYLSRGALKVEAAAGGEGNPYRRQYLEGDAHRVNAEEHTGMLKRDAREALERGFKAKERHAWLPNFVSATPTLEMGVDIGDLSTVLMCGVPPTVAKHVQRSGRSGRANGSALNVTVAEAKEHDVYFYQEPEEMVCGEVGAPGVFLDAVAILERQYLAHALGEWMRSGNALPKNVGAMLAGMARKPEESFPRSFAAWHRAEGPKVYQRFHSRVAGYVNYATSAALQRWVFAGEGEADGLEGRMAAEAEAAKLAVGNYLAKRTELKQRRKAVEKDPGLTEEAKAELLEDLRLEAKSYQALAATLKSETMAAWMSDTAGLLPNYAFPEPGVFLQSVLWRRESEGQPPKFEPYEVSRPASAGLTELVPGAVFFGHGHHVEVDQVDLQKYRPDELEECEWRFCPACDHVEPERSGMPAECPACGAGWADSSQAVRMLPARQFVTVRQSRETLNDETTEQRKPAWWDVKKFFGRREGSAAKAYRCESADVAFGFEWVEHLTMREVNFGKRGGGGGGAALPEVNGERVSGGGFAVCPDCGKAAPEGGKKGVKHSKNCPRRPAGGEGEGEGLLRVNFYREYGTEALRIFVPALEGEDRVLCASFMAALKLGMQEQFRGQVDHLALETQHLTDRGNGVRNLYVIVYDTVPGGTGYLRQFVSDERRQTLIFEVMEKALAKLEKCGCGEDPSKDGCHRCLYRYRNEGGRQNVSRRAAMELLRELAPLKNTVKEAAGGRLFDEIAYAKLLESELEKRFDARLRKWAKGVAGGRAEEVKLPGGGAALRIGLPGDGALGGDGGERAWRVTPQRLLGPEDGVLVQSRPDFAIEPEGDGAKAKPVAVFCDGWEYHKGIAHEDAVKRAALMRAGWRVWSLGWRDVAEGEAGETPEWLARLGAHKKREEMGKQSFGNDFLAERWKTAFNEGEGGKPRQEIERLFAYLRTGDDAAFVRHAEFEAMLLALPPREEGEELVAPTGWGALLEGEAVGDMAADGFRARIALKRGGAAPGKMRAGAAAELDDGEEPGEEAWRAFFIFANYFQFLGERALFWTAKSKGDGYWAKAAGVGDE